LQDQARKKEPKAEETVPKVQKTYSKRPSSEMSSSSSSQNSADAEMKREYIKVRPLIMKSFLESYNIRIKEGTKGRLVVWVVGDLNFRWSTHLIQQIPFDLGSYPLFINMANNVCFTANLSFWKQKLVPPVLRVATTFQTPHKHDVATDTLKQAFLAGLHSQYFELPPYSQR
jgi:hypothetical protein